MTNQLKLQQLVKLLDLTRLTENDQPEAMAQWLQQQSGAPSAQRPFVFTHNFYR
jgi:hypothetical protein